jgi:hypothetical protein
MNINSKNSYEECFSQFRLVGNMTQTLLRRSAADEMINNGMSEIGSSDINNHLYNKWSSNNGDWQKVLLEYSGFAS